MLRYKYMPFLFSYPTFRLVVRIPVSYSEGPGVPNQRPATGTYVRYVNKMPGYCVKLGYSHFLSHPFQFLIH
jgi:hypothetical protein